jgi:hypothetical protein
MDSIEGTKMNLTHDLFYELNGEFRIFYVFYLIIRLDTKE